MNDFTDYFRGLTKRSAGVKLAKVTARNGDGTYQVTDIATGSERRVSKTNPAEEYAPGAWVYIGSPTGGRTVVGVSDVILSRAPADQRGLSGSVPDRTEVEVPGVAIQRLVPEPIILEAGGAGVAASIYGAGFLTAGPVYGDPGITDASAPVVTPRRIDVTVQAGSGVASGEYALTINGTRAPAAIRVTPAVATGFVQGPSLAALSNVIPVFVGSELWIFGIDGSNNPTALRVNTSDLSQLVLSTSGASADQIANTLAVVGSVVYMVCVLGGGNEFVVSYNTATNTWTNYAASGMQFTNGGIVSDGSALYMTGSHFGVQGLYATAAPFAPFSAHTLLNANAPAFMAAIAGTIFGVRPSGANGLTANSTGGGAPATASINGQSVIAIQTFAGGIYTGQDGTAAVGDTAGTGTLRHVNASLGAVDTVALADGVNQIAQSGNSVIVEGNTDLVKVTGWGAPVSIAAIPTNALGGGLVASLTAAFIAGTDGAGNTAVYRIGL